MLEVNLDGAKLCAQYAFAPNFFHYCGPDTRGVIGERVSTATADNELVEKLTQFETLYPYLQAIAHAHGLADPFDPRVVEAYWVGNSLLEGVSEQQTFVAFTEYQQLHKRLPEDDLKWLLPKIDKRARLHHSFHVFNVFTRTGHHTVPHTVHTMDQCRISWGQITNSKIQGTKNLLLPITQLQIESQKLVYKDGKLHLIPAIREVTIASQALLGRLKPKQYLSSHWGFGCDVLTKTQVKQLKYYTDSHLGLANETL